MWMNDYKGNLVVLLLVVEGGTPFWRWLIYMQDYDTVLKAPHFQHNYKVLIWHKKIQIYYKIDMLVLLPKDLNMLWLLLL